MRHFFKTSIHRKKFKKNVALMALVIGLVALIWVISMIKISGAS